MKQDIKISLPLYKMIYSFLFMILLSLVRGISDVTDIGSALDPSIALLAIVFCADTYYQEFQGGRWEIFAMVPIKKKVSVIRRRLIIEYIYLILLGAVGYWFFYLQKPYVIERVHEGLLYGITIVAITASIVFFGGLSMLMVDLTKNIWIGIGIAGIIWLTFNSKFGYSLPMPLQIFGFASMDFHEGINDFSWIWGKAMSVFLAFVFIILQPKLLKREKR